MEKREPPGRPKKLVGNVTNVTFNGGLQSRTRSALVCELVKYLSFQRNQIPLPVDHVKRDLKRRTDKEGNTVRSTFFLCVYNNNNSGAIIFNFVTY